MDVNLTEFKNTRHICKYQSKSLCLLQIHEIVKNQNIHEHETSSDPEHACDSKRFELDRSQTNTYVI